MYTVKIREHIMIAHSFNDTYFGPAQKLHGATYVVDVSFITPQLNEHNVVIDIGRAHEVTKAVLKEINYQNLDEHPKMKEALTTTEYLCKYIHDAIKDFLSAEFDGKLTVTLGESHVAWASYEG